MRVSHRGREEVLAVTIMISSSMKTCHPFPGLQAMPLDRISNITVTNIQPPSPKGAVSSSKILDSRLRPKVPWIGIDVRIIEGFIGQVIIRRILYRYMFLNTWIITIISWSNRTIVIISITMWQRPLLDNRTNDILQTDEIQYSKKEVTHLWFLAVISLDIDNYLLVVLIALEISITYSWKPAPITIEYKTH